MNLESQIQNVNVDLIIPNRFQPRLTFDEKALNELANSIKEHGIIQPLVLRKINDKYEIIAGERRYKAACLAGLNEVPAIITTYDDNKSAEVALIENIQRKNLNSMEEAKSYKKILDKENLTQEALAVKMGISQSALSNKLRLLNLAPEVQEALLNNKISERHARSLLTVNDINRQVSLLNKVISDRLTVRQLDDIIKNNNDVIEVPNNNIQFETDNNKAEDISVFDVASNEKIIDNVYSNNMTLNDIAETKKISENDSNDNLEFLDTLDFDEPVIDNQNKTSIFDIIKAPSYSSLEDEPVNLNMDSNENKEYFNPFENNNISDLQVHEEEKAPIMVPEKEIKSGDLDSVKTAYNNLKKEIEKAGFKIVSEDFDFEDIYQLIIKIDKQD